MPLLTSLEIANFRGIRTGKLSDLGRVNVLVGRNNSGKSTVLDALLVGSSSVEDRDALGRSKMEVVLERHRLKTDSPPAGLWHRYDTNAEIRSHLAYDNGVELDCTHTNTGQSTCTFTHDGTHYVVHAMMGKMQLGSNPDFTDGAFTGMQPLQGALPDELAKYATAAEFLRQTSLVDSDFRRLDLVERRLWQRLIANRADKTLTRMLKDVYGLETDGLTYTPFLGSPSLLLLLPEYSIRIDDLGDGSRYFIRFLMLLSLLRDTVLLMEEPETAHHCAALDKLARWTTKYAVQQNLQVFATTHSLEAVQHFAAACREQQVSFSLIHTRLSDGELTARRADANDAEVLMDMGIDPRTVEPA